jgi:4-hydroxy-tetrahydrodipicolinate reductase
MDLVLIGTGRMGRAVERLAADRGHRVVERFNSDSPFLSVRREDLASADAAIDFTQPDLAVEHIRHAVGLELPIVVGTTGWHDRLSEVEMVVDGSSAGAVLYASNFSIGVALLRRALSAVATVVNRLDDYDVSIHEAHHTGKVDSPSGTALLLARDTLSHIDRKTRIEKETVHEAIDPAALHVTSARVGRVFGRHIVTIDSEADELTLEHRAKSRDGFALGALRAAEWLSSRHGLFTLDDVIDSWIDVESSTSD